MIEMSFVNRSPPILLGFGLSGVLYLPAGVELAATSPSLTSQAVTGLTSQILFWFAEALLLGSLLAVVDCKSFFSCILFDKLVDTVLELVLLTRWQLFRTISKALLCEGLEDMIWFFLSTLPVWFSTLLRNSLHTPSSLYLTLLIMLFSLIPMDLGVIDADWRNLCWVIRLCSCWMWL